MKSRDLNRASGMQASFRLQVSAMRGVGRGERPKHMPLSLDRDLRPPIGPVPANPQIPRVVIAPRLPHVLKVGATVNFSQISQGIIKAIAVYVVNVADWPAPVRNCPRDAMGEIILPAEIKCSIARLTDPTSLRARRSPVADCLQPDDYSRLAVISKKLAKLLGCVRGTFSHIENNLSFGQGRALLTQRFRPAFLNRITICSQGYAA